MSENNIILDASAVLAFVNQELGKERVESVLGKAYISTINVAEVITHLANQGVTETEVEEVLEDLDLAIIPFDKRQSIVTGLLRPATKNFGLSLGDWTPSMLRKRACLSLAMIKQLPVLTADRIWLELNLQIDIQTIR